VRTGRALRKPGRVAAQRKNRIPDMVNIAQRPPEADDRRVPGHWEGDLLIGKRSATAIGTLVERSSGFAMLVPLPDGLQARARRACLARKVQTLPEALRRSLTWDWAGGCATGSRGMSAPASKCSSAIRNARARVGGLWQVNVHSNGGASASSVAGAADGLVVRMRGEMQDGETETSRPWTEISPVDHPPAARRSSE
jgi:hypothetical protein